MPAKNQIKDMFEKISPVYDLANHLLSFGLDVLWRKRLAEKISPSSPCYILDLACGTADLALAIKKAIPQANIIGADLSLKMLKIASRKIKRKKLEKDFLLIQAEAENLPLQSSSLDAVAVAFGIRNFEDRKKALSEIYRVLNPDGILAILEFSLPENKLMRFLYRLYLGKILPLLGAILSGERAYYYLRDSIHQFPNPTDFSKEISSEQFEIKEVCKLTSGIVTLYLAQKST